MTGVKRTKADTDEPTKKPLELNAAVVKDYEKCSLKEIAAAPVSALEGVGPVTTEALNALGLQTVTDLADYKFYKVAKAITTLADKGSGVRHADSQMNINNAVMKKSEELSFEDIAASPVSILQGLSEEKGELFKKMHVTTVQELADLKYMHWAEAIVCLSQYEMANTDPANDELLVQPEPPASMPAV